MKKFRSHLRSLLTAPSLAVFASLASVPTSAAEWEEVLKEDGVTVYEKEVGDDVAFRGEGLIAGHPGKLLHAICDPAHWEEWIDDLDSGRLLEKKSDFHAVYYQAFNSPFPVADRDIVYEARAHRDPKTGKIIVDMRSVNHPKAPKTVGVRVKLKYTRYEITVLPGAQLHVVLETLSDPGGNLPGFLVNRAQRKYPVKLFQGLREQVKKAHAKIAQVPK